MTLMTSPRTRSFKKLCATIASAPETILLPGNPLLFLGHAGSGKTNLLLTAIHSLLDENRTVILLGSPPQLNASMKVANATTLNLPFCNASGTLLLRQFPEPAALTYKKSQLAYLNDEISSMANTHSSVDLAILDLATISGDENAYRHLHAIATTIHHLNGHLLAASEKTTLLSPLFPTHLSCAFNGKSRAVRLDCGPAHSTRKWAPID